MALIVQKYGGTSVGTPERIGQVADKVAGWRKKGNDIVVVVSAMSGETDRLLSLADAVAGIPPPRELDVLRLLARGLSNADIAQRLYLSEGTVRNYVSAVLSKLDVADRTQAAVLALRHGLVAGDDES